MDISITHKKKCLTKIQEMESEIVFLNQKCDALTKENTLEKSIIIKQKEKRELLV